MAENKRISDLNPLNPAASGDLFAIVDFSASETKKITKQDLMASPGPIGSSTPGTGNFTNLSLPSGSTVVEFSTDGTLGSDSDTAVPTERAVKSYVDNAVSNIVTLNIVHTSSDSTAVGGDVVLIDNATGDKTVELNPSDEGRILVIKDSSSANKVVITTSSGVIYDGAPVASVEILVDYGVYEFLCDGVNFYII